MRTFRVWPNHLSSVSRAQMRNHADLTSKIRALFVLDFDVLKIVFA